MVGVKAPVAAVLGAGTGRSDAVGVVVRCGVVRVLVAGQRLYSDQNRGGARARARARARAGGAETPAHLDLHHQSWADQPSKRARHI